MVHFINHSDLLKKTRLLAVLLIVFLLPQGLWAQTLSKTYTFTGATPNLRYEGNTIYYPPGGTLECNGITTWDAPGDDNSGGCKFDRDREFIVKKNNGLLVSRDKFHKVTKITIGINVWASQRWGRFSYDGSNMGAGRVSSQSQGTGDQELVLDFSNNPITIDDVLRISVETSSDWEYCFTLNSITVEYERTNLGLWFRSAMEPWENITELSLNWSDCLNNNYSFPSLLDSSDNYVQDLAVDYTSSNESVVTFDQSGNYNIVSPGQTIVTATFDGDTQFKPESLSYTLTINDDRPPLSQCRAELNPESREYNGGRQSTVMRIYDPSGASLVEGTDFSVSQSDNMVNAGSYTITATASKYCNYSGQLTATYTITPVSLGNAVITVSPTSLVYNGTAQEPTVSVAFMNAKTNELETPLIAGTDYTVSYSNNTNVTNNATVTVTGKRNYTGTNTTTFSITKATPTLSTTPAAIANLTYNGKAQNLITAGVATAGTLQYSTDGTNYSTNIPQGTAAQEYTVYYKVVGNANYNGIAAQSFKVTIAKATVTLSFSPTTVTVELGETLNAPNLNNPSNVTVTYSSSDTKVATVNAQTGAVTPLKDGKATITATYAGDGNHKGATAQYTLTVTDNAVKYGLWVSDIQVTERNCKDILGDGSADQGKAASFQYVPSLNKLFITNNTDNLSIRTTNDEGLTIYLAPNSTNAVGNIVYNGNGNATLTITTDGNYPGTLSLSANANVISGFSSLTLEQNLVIMSPEDIAYDGSNRRLATTAATIGAPLTPITKDRTITPDGNELKPESGSEDINKVVDDILYTLGNVNNSNGDGYDDGGFIVINTVTTDQQAVRVTQEFTPGTNEYLEGFKGLTFMVPAGNGKIFFDMQTLDGYAMKVMVGDAAPVTVKKAEKGIVEIPYNVAEPTYVYAYNAGMIGNTSSARGIQKGKMTTVHIKVYGTSVKTNKVKQSNSAAQASGGEYRGDTSALEGQEMETDEEIEAGKGDINGDEAVNVADIVGITNAIRGRHSATFDKRAADANGDGRVNAEDIAITIQKMMGQ